MIDIQNMIRIATKDQQTEVNFNHIEWIVDQVITNTKEVGIIKRLKNIEVKIKIENP